MPDLPNPQRFTGQLVFFTLLMLAALLSPLLIFKVGMLGVLLAVGVAGFVVSLFTHPLLVLALYFGALFFKDLQAPGIGISINQILAPLFFLSVFIHFLRGKTLSPYFQLFPALAIVVGYFILSGLFGQDLENGLLYSRYAVIYLALSAGVAMCLTSERTIYALAWIIVGLTTIAAVDGFYEAYDKNLLNVVGKFLAKGTRVQGTAPNPIVFGWNMIYGFPFAFLLFAQLKTAALRLLALVMGLSMIGVATFTFNRQTYVISAIVLVMCALLFTYKNRAVLVSLLSGLGIVGAFTVLPLVLRRLMTVATLNKDYSFLERQDAFLMGSEMFRRHPITGVGFGAYSKVWSQYIPADYPTYFAQYRGASFEKFMDMGLFSILAETGLIGITLFSGMFLILFIHAWRYRRRAVRAGDAFAQNVASTVIVVLAFFFVSSFIQDTFLYTRIWILYGLALILDRRHLPILGEEAAQIETPALDASPAELPAS